MSRARAKSTARVAVVQLPGVNCEAETVRALERVGLEPEVFRWTRSAHELKRFDPTGDQRTRWEGRRLTGRRFVEHGAVDQPAPVGHIYDVVRGR